MIPIRLGSYGALPGSPSSSSYTGSPYALKAVHRARRRSAVPLAAAARSISGDVVVLCLLLVLVGGVLFFAGSKAPTRRTRKMNGVRCGATMAAAGRQCARRSLLRVMNL